MALMCVDLDGFKDINGTFGHQGVNDLLHRADEQMYAAKRAGKNAFCMEYAKPPPLQRDSAMR